MGDWPNRLIDLSDVAVQTEPASGKVPVWNSTTKKWDWAAPAPAAHATTHQPGGSDAMAVDAAAGTGSLRTIGKTALKAADGLDTEYAFSAWKDLGPTYAGTITPSWAAGTYLLYHSGFLSLNAANNVVGARYLDPADFAGSRTTKVRLRATYEVGGTGPGVTFTWGIASVATWMTAAAAARAGINTLNTALATVAVVSPGANTQGHAETAAATLTAGYWVVTLALSGTSAASSNLDTQVQLQYQQV